MIQKFFNFILWIFESPLPVDDRKAFAYEYRVGIYGCTEYLSVKSDRLSKSGQYYFEYSTFD